MRALNSNTSGAALIVTLALSVATPALADTFTVTDATNVGNGEYASLRQAIQAANQAGFANAPHQIIIDSAGYDPANGDVVDASNCQAQSPLPVIFVPVELSSTGGADATAGIPGLTSRDSLSIEGLTVTGTQSWVVFPFGGQSAQCNFSSIVVAGGELTMTDSKVIGPDGTGSAPGIQLVDSSASLVNVEVSNYRNGLDAIREFSEDELTLDITGSTFDNGETEGPSGQGIYAFSYNSGSITDTTVTGWMEGGAIFDFGDWVITNGSFTGNSDGLVILDANADIAGTTFEDNEEQALYAAGYGNQFNGGTNVTVDGASFTNNGFGGNGRAGAITYLNESGQGSLVVSDSSFIDNVGEEFELGFDGVEGGAGAIYANGRVEITNVTASNMSGRVPAFGGFLRLIGDGTITGSTFTNLEARNGGAIHHSFESNDQIQRGAYLHISDTTFDGMTAVFGGVLHTLRGATTTLTNVTATDTMAQSSGGFAHLNASQESRRSFPQDELRAAAVAADSQLRGSEPGHLIINNLTVTDSLATSGGVFGASYDANSIMAENVVVTNARAQSQLIPQRRGGFPVEVFISGSGGFLAVHDGSYVDIKNLTVDNSSAGEFGGLIFSGPSIVESDIFLPSGDISNCEEPYSQLLSFGLRESRIGNTIRIDGVMASDLGAGFDAGIALFSDSDVVEIHSGEFTTIETGLEQDIPQFRGLPGFGSNTGHIVTQNVSSFDMTCIEICDDSAVGAAVHHYESPQFSSNSTRRPSLHHENNVYSGIAATNAVVNLDVCDAVQDGGGRDSGIFVNAEGTDTDFGTGNGDTARDTDWFDTGRPDTAVTGVGPRGRLSVGFTTFLGSSDSVAIGGVGENMPVRVSHNIFSDLDIAMALFDTSFVAGGYNLYDSVTTVPQGDAAPVFPAPTDLTDTAQFTDAEAECGSLALWLEDGSPGQDAGNPEIQDWWNESVADMGAFGGPRACFPDEDKDGFIVVLDCDDLDLEIRPGANETPYDGIDQDCDGIDLCDVDEDGFLSDALSCGGDDCDDARPDINPDAEEIWYDGIDQDCSGNDCDQDGDGYTADSEECGGVDCNDEDASIYPGAPETDGDSIDSDCNGDDNVPVGCDADEDGYISDSEECGGVDCNDDDASIYPGAPETDGDGIDSDCNDEDNVPAGCDQDGDGVISDSEECGGIDCNDDDATIYPGAPETAGDGIDSDCNGDDDPLLDERCDEDGDGVLSDSAECGGIDCNDDDATIYPGAEDVPYDGIDQDCSGEDNCDADFDGFAAIDGDCGGDDCDDTDPTIYPGAGEIPDDGIDQDCDSEDGVVFVQGGPAGCGCSSTSSSAPVGLLWLGALAVVGVRRRRS